MNNLLVSFLAAATLGAMPPALATLAVADPRCEGLRQPEQVDTPAPRFSWRLDADGRDVRQTACQLRVTEIDAAGRALGAVFETARLATGESQWVVPPDFTPKPRAVYAWQVRVWDNRGQASDWSEPRRFGTGLLGARWPADWIGDGRTLAVFQTAPARHFRGGFKLDHLPVRARLYVSALGLVEPWLNGRPVTADRFVPGWPDYRRRVFYVAFDVTPLLQAGGNTLGMILGDGWYSGTMIPRHQYGPEAMCSAFLDLTDADGRVTTITTGDGWKWTDQGPITLNSIYDGETYDARRELAGWSAPGQPAQGGDWRPVSVRAGRHTPAAFTARLSPPVRRIESIKPISVRRMAPGVQIYDLGQNMVGWVRLRVRAGAGREIKLRFTEMLDADGRLFTANLRSAKATATYIAKGEGLEEWEPRFTYFGFRYVELSGIDEPLADAIEGVVVHTDLPRVGTFECSDPLLNQLYHNALWSQKGNFLELPTDCPQRDERVGWTGDAQIFAPTALYNLDAGAFYRQWLFSLRDGLRDDPNGGFPDVAPYTGFGHGSAGWAEAGMIVPWTVWLHTGDRRVLAESLPAIQHALELMAAQAPDGIRLSPPTWGDWLAPGFPKYKSPPRQDLIGTAYYAQAADLAARIADVLGRPELAAGNRALRDKARAAYQSAYIATDGRVADDVQTSYLLTLAFGLAPPAQRPQLAAHLLRTIAEKDNHLATGFLGTPLLAPVLTDLGRADVAYRILQQTTYPGWLFTVKNGATTIWERWDSWTPGEGFNKDGMNSFNHYAYGSVVGWFYSTIAGLAPLPEAPGWKKFRIAPVPGGGLTSAATTLDTPYGPAAAAWKIEAGMMRLTVRIPANTSAEVVLPAAGPVQLDGQPLSQSKFARDMSAAGGRTTVTLPSGDYEFAFRPVTPAPREG
jgi:alpha-L-rhamnosidase